MTAASDTMNELPSSLPRPPDEVEKLERVWRTPRGLAFLTTVNNTNIGLLYIGTALLFFVLAGILGLMIRAQLAVPDAGLFRRSILSPEMVEGFQAFFEKRPPRWPRDRS